MSPEHEACSGYVLDPSAISEALLVWTGWHETPWPTRDEGEVRLAARFGTDHAAALLQQLRHLEDDFYRSEARFTAPDPESLGDAAAAEFRASHPEVSEEAVQALAWCYAFDFK